jgi:hypothetical protein
VRYSHFLGSVPKESPCIKVDINQNFFKHRFYRNASINKQAKLFQKHRTLLISSEDTVPDVGLLSSFSILVAAGAGIHSRFQKSFLL